MSSKIIPDITNVSISTLSKTDKVDKKENDKQEENGERDIEREIDIYEDNYDDFDDSDFDNYYDSDDSDDTNFDDPKIYKEEEVELTHEMIEWIKNIDEPDINLIEKLLRKKFPILRGKIPFTLAYKIDMIFNGCGGHWFRSAYNYPKVNDIITSWGIQYRVKSASIFTLSV